jgi:hypothetical protein
MSNETEWWYFQQREQAEQAAAEITERGEYLCQVGHVTDDTMAEPAIGLAIYDEPGNERPWVLAIGYDGDALPPVPDGEPGPIILIAGSHGGELGEHEYTILSPG